MTTATLEQTAEETCVQQDICPLREPWCNVYNQYSCKVGVCLDGDWDKKYLNCILYQVFKDKC